MVKSVETSPNCWKTPHSNPATKDLRDIIKSPLDSSSYKAFELVNNGLKAIVISTCEHELGINDEEVDKATCAYNKILSFNSKYLHIHSETLTEIKNPKSKSNGSKPKKKFKLLSSNRRNDVRTDIVTVVLVVGAGRFHDPDEVPGMAHFCEHAIFLGSKKYPESETLQNFISERGGEVNARTDPEYTSYYFSVATDHIDEALKIFADSIVDPLLDDRVIKEINSVDAEFEIKKMDEELRYLALLQLSAKPNHPFGKFGMGTKETLGVQDLKGKLMLWKNRYYNANYMTLAIRGPLPVEKMEKLVITNFWAVSHTTLPSPAKVISNHGTPFESSKWHKLYRCIPILDQQWLKITWCLPPAVCKNYRTKPLQYLLYVLSSKAEGGLDYCLRQKGWVSGICPACPDNSMQANQFCSLFSITMELTDDGLANEKEILKILFSYLRMMQTQKPVERIFEEIKYMNADAFHYSSDKNLQPISNPDYDDNIEFVRELCEMLQTVDISDLLISKFLIVTYDEFVISGLLDLLCPNTACVTVGSKKFKDVCKREDHRYGIMYCEENMSSSFVEELHSIPTDSKFCYPPPNVFAKDSLCYPIDPKEKLEFEENLIILNCAKATIEYSNSECLKGHLPTASYSIQIVSASGNELKKGCSIMMSIWTKTLGYLLDLKLTSALNALISQDILYFEDTLSIDLYGPSSRLPVVFQVIMDTFLNIENEINQRTFRMMVGLVRDEIVNLTFQNDSFADELLNSHIFCRYYSVYQNVKYLRETNLSEFLNFVSRFKQKMYISGDLRGCVSKSQAQKISDTILKMNYSPWKRSQDIGQVNRGMMLPLGERCLRVKAKNLKDNTSMIKNHYQLGILGKQDRLMLDLIVATIANFCFEQLRTKEQLGYIVDIYPEVYFQCHGLTVIVNAKSDDFTTSYINDRIDNFILYFYNEIINDNSQFTIHLKSLLNSEKKEHVKWREMKKFYEKYFLPDGKEYRKLSVQVVGSQSKPEYLPRDSHQIEAKVKKFSSGRPRPVGTREEHPPILLDLPHNITELNGYFITDILRFKRSLNVYPNASGFESSDSDESDDED